MANIITSCRIILSAILLFAPTLSFGFYSVYFLCGFTDMLDGFVARKTGTESELGSRLDTIADFVFIAVCLIKLLPVLNISIWMWVWIGIIAVIKIINVIGGYIIHNKFIAVHTIINKVTGAVLFALPFTIFFVDIKYSGCAACIIATFAALQEGYLIKTRKV